ncbi:MAG: glycosyltransferase, partial [Chitinophagaceae bacterium]
MLLSIIIVNYHSTKLLLDCLASLRLHSDIHSCEILLVDNGSIESEKKIVLQSFPSLNWLDMPSNAGFARANNAGMRQAKGDLFLLLNPDTIAIDDSIA